MNRMFVKLLVCLLGIVAPAAAQDSYFDYSGKIEIESEPGDAFEHGKPFKYGPGDDIGVKVTDEDLDGIPDSISIWHPLENWDWSFHFSVFPTGGLLKVGTYDPAKWPMGDGKFFFGARTPNEWVSLCMYGFGTYSVTAAEFELLKVDGYVDYEAFAAKSFRVNFEMECDNFEVDGKMRGTVSVNMVGGGAPSEPDPGEEEPAPPPPPPPPVYVKLVAPVMGIAVENGAVSSAPITTSVHDGYEGEVRLEAFAPPGLTVTFDPAVIPSPGAGSSILSIAADEYLLPLRHLIEIRASGPPTPVSVVIPIIMECDPPFVTAVDVPANTFVDDGQSTTLRIAATGSPMLRYQWYEGPRGSLFRPIAGATGSELTVGPLTRTAQYWVRVSNACGTWDSPTMNVKNRNWVKSRPTGR